MTIWSLPKNENLTIGKNVVEKRRISPLFHNIFNISSNFKSPITQIFVKSGCSNYCFLNSANLICRGTDISKYFRESLGIQDNESRLYLVDLMSTNAIYQAFLCLKKEVLKCFYSIWAWQPSCSIVQNHFIKLLVPLPQKVQCEIC